MAAFQTYIHQSVELSLVIIGLLYGIAFGLILFARNWKFCFWLNGMIRGVAKLAVMGLIGVGVIASNCLNAVIEFFF